MLLSKHLLLSLADDCKIIKKGLQWRANFVRQIPANYIISQPGQYCDAESIFRGDVTPLTEDGQVDEATPASNQSTLTASERSYRPLSALYPCDSCPFIKLLRMRDMGTSQFMGSGHSCRIVKLKNLLLEV